MKKRSESLRKPLMFSSRGSKKRGISAVVAAVLIILIVIVGVGIVWKVILPLFAELGYFSYSEVQLNIVFQGYTVYDPAQHFAFVQIERGRDEVNVAGLEIGFIFEGDSTTYQTEAVPEPGGKYTYKFNFTDDGLEEVPDKVTVAPIFLLNNQFKLGEILDEEDMPIGRVYLSIEKWKEANEEAADNNITKGIGSSEGEVTKDLYYYDSDGDGYGNDSISQEFDSGSQGTGYVLVAGDCDDFDDSRSPGKEEIFNNAIDENCNGFNELNDCVYLDGSGNYLLINDLDLDEDEDLIERACFFVRADGVNINLGNHEVHVNDWSTSPTGVRFDDYNGVALSNGTISGFYSGMFTNGGSRISITDMNFTGNSNGPQFYFSEDIILEDSFMCGNVNDVGCMGSSNLSGEGNYFSSFSQSSCTDVDIQGSDCTELGYPNYISGCGTIDEPGNYELFFDLNVYPSSQVEFTMPDLDYPGYVTDRSCCILINGTDISLNLREHVITCDGICGWSPIYILNSENINVSNGEMSTGFSYGAISYNSYNVRLDNLEIHDTRYGGIDMHFTNNSFVKNILMSNIPQIGMTVWKSSYNLLEDNTFCGSGLWNVYCSDSQDNSGSGNIFDDTHYWECPGWDIVPVSGCS